MVQEEVELTARGVQVRHLLPRQRHVTEGRKKKDGNIPLLKSKYKGREARTATGRWKQFALRVCSVFRGADWKKKRFIENVER